MNNESLRTLCPKVGYIKVSDPIALLDRVELLVKESKEWKVYRRKIIGCDQGLAVNFLTCPPPVSDLGFLLFLFSDSPNELQLSIRAVSWGEGRLFPSDEEYQSAEKKAWGLIQLAGKSMGILLRLSRRGAKPNPLRGSLKKAFNSFIHVATDIWTGEKMTYLDIRDEIKWHDFIRLAHQHCSVLTPDDLSYHFRLEGFSDEFINEVISHYIIGRRVLSRRLYPWEERKRLKYIRRIDKERDKKIKRRY